MANRNFKKGIKKTSAGNYFGYCNGYWIFIFRRPHGAWCCQIGRKGKCIWSEGYHGTYLKTVKAAKQWAKNIADVMFSLPSNADQKENKKAGEVVLPDEEITADVIDKWCKAVNESEELKY